MKTFTRFLAALLMLTAVAYCQQPVTVLNWGGANTLGAPSAYGTSPGAVTVPGVNAFVTNSVAVTGTFWQTTQPVSGTFWQTTQPVSLASWAGGTLGSMANYGTSPGAVLVPGVNAYVTNAISTTAPSPSTSSTYAYTMYHHVFAGTGLNIKSSAGNLYGLVIENPGSIPCWVQLYNTAGTPTIGTSVIDSYMVQAGLTVTINPGQLALENFATGIGIAAATADAGATTTGCTTISLTAYYQ